MLACYAVEFVIVPSESAESPENRSDRPDTAVSHNRSGSAAEGDNSASAADSQRSVVLEFSRISQGLREVVIEHNGQLYRLRATRNGGLILNK